MKQKQFCLNKKEYELLIKQKRLKTLYKSLAISFIIITIGIATFFIGYTLNPPRNDPRTFQFELLFDDFYVQDIDTLEKNYSYNVNHIEISSMYFSNDTFNVISKMNATSFLLYFMENGFLVSTQFMGFASNTIDGLDNRSFSTRIIPNLIVMDISIDIYDENGEEWHNEVVFSMWVYDYMSNNVTIGDYYYLLETFNDSSIRIIGCTYNNTTNAFEKLFIKWNNVEKEVLAL